MQKEASALVFTRLVPGVSSHSSRLFPMPSMSHQCLTLSPHLISTIVLSHGIYRLTHDVSLRVEYLPPSVLTIILRGVS